MVKLIKQIVIAMAIFAAVTGCGITSEVSAVRNGHFSNMSNNVTIGEIFNSMHSGKTTWTSTTLEDTRWIDDDYSLVEASWSEAGKNVIVQFVVAHTTKDFEVQGAAIEGEFVDADYLLDTIFQKYESIVIAQGAE